MTQQGRWTGLTAAALVGCQAGLPTQTFFPLAAVALPISQLTVSAWTLNLIAGPGTLILHTEGGRVVRIVDGFAVRNVTAGGTLIENVPRLMTGFAATTNWLGGGEPVPVQFLIDAFRQDDGSYQGFITTAGTQTPFNLSAAPFFMLGLCVDSASCAPVFGALPPPPATQPATQPAQGT